MVTALAGMRASHRDAGGVVVSAWIVALALRHCVLKKMVPPVRGEKWLLLVRCTGHGTRVVSHLREPRIVQQNSVRLVRSYRMTK